MAIPGTSYLHGAAKPHLLLDPLSGIRVPLSTHLPGHICHFLWPFPNNHLPKTPPHFCCNFSRYSILLIAKSYLSRTSSGIGHYQLLSPWKFSSLGYVTLYSLGLLFSFCCRLFFFCTSFKWRCSSGFCPWPSSHLTLSTHPGNHIHIPLSSTRIHLPKSPRSFPPAHSFLCSNSPTHVPINMSCMYF